MYRKGEHIDGKYTVEGLCSDSGGMGAILHVTPTSASYPFRIVLKYCKEADTEIRQRFIREVRYLANMNGNSRIVQIVDYNLEAEPPYFVMKFYSDGDLSRIADKLRASSELQEVVFNKMLDCIGELHKANLQHRDIKPQNFLIEGDALVVSDLGLAKAVGAGTTFTVSKDYWGTHGYMPPEFISEGFKSSEPTADIFMIGKTFYVLLTGRDPFYLADGGIHPALYHVIERCCAVKPGNRYDSIAALRQDLKLAFDVILGRAQGLGSARQLLSQILAQLNAENRYDANVVGNFLDLLAKLPDHDRSHILRDVPVAFYRVLSQAPAEPKLDKFLEQYESFVRGAVGTWSYAETVADNMRILFENAVSLRHRARALDIAILGAIEANRFAAMDTCIAMITGVSDEQLGVAIAPLITRYKSSFVGNIEPSACRSDAVRNALSAQEPSIYLKP